MNVRTELAPLPTTRKVFFMSLNPILIAPIVALIAGILVLVMPRLLNFTVAIYLIVIGVVGLAPHFIH